VKKDYIPTFFKLSNTLPSQLSWHNFSKTFSQLSILYKFWPKTSPTARKHNSNFFWL